MAGNDHSAEKGVVTARTCRRARVWIVHNALVRERGRVLRNRTNWVSGWVLAIGVPAFVMGAADPLAAHSSAAETGWNQFMLTATAASAVLSLGGYALFARPVVVLGPTHVRVRNPLSDHVFARADVTRAAAGLWYPYVVVAGRRIRLLALEKSLWQVLQGAPQQQGVADALNEQEGSPPPYQGRHVGPLPLLEAKRTSAISWRPGRWTGTRAIDWVAVILSALWVIYVMMAWIGRNDAF